MAGNRNTAKLHHYVPQGYLRGFATEKGRITAVPLDRSRSPFTSSVKNVAAQTHFHTVDGLDEPDEFEKMLSGVEGDAIEIIRKFERGEFSPFRKRPLEVRLLHGPSGRAWTRHPQGDWSTFGQRWFGSKSALAVAKTSVDGSRRT